MEINDATRTASTPEQSPPATSTTADGNRVAIGYNVPIDLIVARYNPRRYFDQKKIDEFAESIRAQGIIEPLVLRVADDDGMHTIICGGRRYRAAKIAGLAEVPAVFRDVDEATAKAMAITENVHREGLSPAEEARSARDLLDCHEGDHAAVAKELAWTAAMLKARLALLHCSDAVLTALDERQLTAPHAELLSTLPHAKQDAALPRILTEKVSVAQLREELQGYAIPLSTAPFDTSKTCNLCEFNSGHQLSLFGQGLDKARCSNKACFTKLSREALQVKRNELLDEFATVALVTEKDADSITTVRPTGPNGVGEVQFATGCKGCKFFGVLIEDRLKPTIGEVQRNVCFDAQGCHKEKVAAYRSLIATPVVVEDAHSTATASSIPTKAATPSHAGKKSTAAAASKAKANAKALPGSVVTYAEKFYQTVAAKLLASDATAALALALITTAKLPMPNKVIHPLDKAAPVRSTASQKDNAAFRVGVLAKLELTELVALSQRIAAESVKAEAKFASYGADFDPIGVARSLVAAKEVDLSLHFTLDKGYLEANTLSGIESVLDESGFSKWFIETNPDGEKGFKKLTTGRKTDVITGVLAAGFDWKGFVPESLRNFRTKPTR